MKNMTNQYIDFEIITLKILIVITTVTLLLMFFHISKDRFSCDSICKEKGFHDFRYIPSVRYGIGGNNCYCLTEEESNMSKRTPMGTKVY